MESNPVNHASPHQRPDAVLDSKKLDESDIDQTGTLSNEGSETKKDAEPSPRQIHGIKVRASKVKLFAY